MVRLIDGAIHSEEVIIPKGESGNPMSAGELEEKFVSLAAPVLGRERAIVITNEVQLLDSRESLDGLVASLTA